MSYFVRGFPGKLATVCYLAYVAHLLSAVAQVLLTEHYFGGGDMLVYALEGRWIARLIETDPVRFVPDVIRLTLQQDYHLPVRVIGAGSTASMAGISGLLFALVGGSTQAGIAVVATSSFIGKLVLVRSFRAGGLEYRGNPIAGVILLLPSSTFWASGLLKESVAMGPLCVMAAALNRLSRRASPMPVVTMGIAALPVALVKPYILFAFAAGSGALIYSRFAARRGTVLGKPLYLALAALVAFGGVLALGRIFPQFQVERLGESVANLQLVGQRVEGGSNYSIGDPGERSLVGQLAFAPLALFTSLFRPLFFEIHNAVSLLAAAEATVILLLALRAVRSNPWAELFRQTAGSPMVAFCAAFTGVFGLAVGLATTNLGSLSRYRMPLLPFWMVLLVVWNRDLFSPARKASVPAPRVGVPRHRSGAPPPRPAGRVT